MRKAPHHRLLIIGDSISLGVEELRISEIVARVPTCYVDLLRENLPATEILVDADIHRTTTAALTVIDALLAQHRPCVVLLMLGGNDADVEWKRFIISDGRIVRNRLSVAQCSANLEILARKVLAAGAFPILTDMPNHDLALRGPYLSELSGKNVAALIAGNGGQQRSDRGLEEYRQAAARAAKHTGSAFVDYGAALHRFPSAQVIGREGVHPNSKAHQIIANELLPTLRTALQHCGEHHVPTARVS